jgi:hypothetical protein
MYINMRRTLKLGAVYRALAPSQGLLLLIQGHDGAGQNAGSSQSAVESSEYFPIRSLQQVHEYRQDQLFANAQGDYTDHYDHERE